MLFDFLFPNRCIECDLIISPKEIICESCFEKINFTHWNFSKNNPLKQKAKLLFPVENAFALMHFENESLSRKIIHQLKYAQRPKIGYHLAKWTTERLNFNNEIPDFIISTPLHKNKFKNRGYNQTHIFTEKIAKYYKIPCSHTLLEKKSDNKAQASKDKNQRLKTEYKFCLTQDIQNKHILIVDDVYTTGNTMCSMAWELINNGNNKVSILVMAVD